MSAGRVSQGPLEIAEMDIHLINEVFRQIQERIDYLTGLAGPITLYDRLTFTSNVTIPLPGITVDASQVTYTPSDVVDWGGTDPGNVDDALDALAADVALVSSTTTTTTTGSGDEEECLDTLPWEMVQLREDTMAMYEQADGNAVQLKSLQVVVAGDDLIGALQPLTDGSGNLVYA